MYNEKEFKELEAEALKDHLFIDTQIITATPGFDVAACTVSDKEGKRVFRAVEGTRVAEVTECAITVALCAYYDKPIPAVFRTLISTEEPVKKSSTGTGKQAPITKNTSTPQSDTVSGPADEQIKMPAVGGTSDADKAAKTVDKDNATASTTTPAASTTPPAESTTTPTASTTASADSFDADQDNFRVLVGNYKRRDDNYIKQMLETDEGRKFLKSVIGIATPSVNIKPYVDQTKVYLKAHNIQL